jgi:hypothetical protein
MHLAAAEQLTVQLNNSGPESLAGFLVSYAIDNNSPVTETVNDTIPAHGTLTYTFSQAADFSVTKTYLVKVYSESPCDQHLFNDTLRSVVSCTPDLALLVYDNGPFMTTAGIGAGAADVSELQNLHGMGSLGFDHSASVKCRVADDFIVPGHATWTIQTIEFFAYEDMSGSTSTINNLNFQVWSGPPDTDCEIVFGNTTTNRLSGTTFTNVYRVYQTVTSSISRPVMRNFCNINPPLILGHGSYWIDWQTGGTSSYTPRAVPITILGNTVTGNAMQFSAGHWAPAIDGGTNTPQGFPFRLYGSILLGSDQEMPPSITIYPNPSNGKYRISSTTEAVERVLVMDIFGRVVYEKLPRSKYFDVDLTGLPPGLYFTKAITASGGRTVKIILE